MNEPLPVLHRGTMYSWPIGWAVGSVGFGLLIRHGSSTTTVFPEPLQSAMLTGNTTGMKIAAGQRAGHGRRDGGRRELVDPEHAGERRPEHLAATDRDALRAGRDRGVAGVGRTDLLRERRVRRDHAERGQHAAGQIRVVGLVACRGDWQPPSRRSRR